MNVYLGEYRDEACALNIHFNYLSNVLLRIFTKQPAYLGLLRHVFWAETVSNLCLAKPFKFLSRP